MSATAVSFDGNSLQTANIITSDIVHESIPTKDAKLYALAHANASAIPYTSYPTKTITLNGYITASGQAALDGVLDTFRGYFINTNANLDIQYYNSTRRYIATVNSLSVDRPGGLTLANFSIEFVTTQPFGQDTTSSTILSASGRTSASYSDNFTFGGTAPVQRPVFTLTISALTGGTGAAVTVGNNATGQQITVTRTYTAGDVLVVDVSQKTVTVNGTPVVYTGAFPEFGTGAQTLTYSDTLSTRTFSETVTYYPLYL